MNGQQLQMPTYQQISGAVQLPLVMLVWCALLLFFGYQYQANALLPQHAESASQAEFDNQALLRVQQRNDRLLAELAAQAPVELPKLLNRQDFGEDLAAALAGSTLGRGDWQPQQPSDRVTPVASKVVPAVQPKTQTQAPTVAPAKVQKFSRSPSKRINTLAAASVVEPVSTKAPKATDRKSSKTVPVRNQKAAKFVRLPATVNAVIKTQADPLRATKDRAREALQAGRIGTAYQYLRGKVTQGRTDIEYLGLLALASLHQHPDEAEVIYRHLTQLQPDVKRWQQGLDHSLQLRVAHSGAEPNTNLSSASDVQTASVAG